VPRKVRRRRAQVAWLRKVYGLRQVHGLYQIEGHGQIGYRRHVDNGTHVRFGKVGNRVGDASVAGAPEKYQGE